MLNHSKYPWLKVEKTFEEKDKPVNANLYNRLATVRICLLVSAPRSKKMSIIELYHLGFGNSTSDSGSAMNHWWNTVFCDRFCFSSSSSHHSGSYSPQTKKVTPKFNPDTANPPKPSVRDQPETKNPEFERLSKPAHVTPKFIPPAPPAYRSREEIPQPNNPATYDRLAEPPRKTPKFEIRLSEYEKAQVAQRDHVEALGPLQNEEYYRDLAVPLGGMDKIDLTTYRERRASSKERVQHFSSSMAEPTPSVPRIPGTGNQPTRTQKLKAASPRKSSTNPAPSEADMPQGGNKQD